MEVLKILMYWFYVNIWMSYLRNSADMNKHSVSTLQLSASLCQLTLWLVQTIRFLFGTLKWQIIKLIAFQYLPCQAWYWMASLLLTPCCNKCQYLLKPPHDHLTLWSWLLILHNNFEIHICTGYYRVGHSPTLI